MAPKIMIVGPRYDSLVCENLATVDLITTNLPDEPNVEMAREIFEVRLRLLAKKMEPGCRPPPNVHPTTGIVSLDGSRVAMMVRVGGGHRL